LNSGGFFDLPTKIERIKSIQASMNEANFWNDSASANKLMSELKFLKSCVEPFDVLEDKIKEATELLEISQNDEQMIAQIEEEIVRIEASVGELEVKSFLSGPFDRNSALLSINAGAGGTESCDWASMLLRMYQRYAEDKGFDVKTLDFLPGEGAGIKNVMLSIEGPMAYGYLRSEKGVHRLVRISPFDSNKRRHTSFASVDVIPQIEEDIEIEIKPEDLRIDIYRSSGPGGQSVNTTDSAVRMTHLPSGIVVQCQNERSQQQNRQVAMRILRAKLYEKKQKEQEEMMAKHQGTKQKIEWGSQIRSYVMQPYLMVKDHRTDVETGNVQKVMDGWLDPFVEAFLRIKTT